MIFGNSGPSRAIQHQKRPWCFSFCIPAPLYILHDPTLFNYHNIRLQSHLLEAYI